jgi:hypothetical protein
MPEATVGPPVSELSVGLTAEYRPSHIASTVGEGLRHIGGAARGDTDRGRSILDAPGGAS